MVAYVREESGFDEDEAALPETIPSLYPPGLALDLWLAWKKGVMPEAGGYLQQPRAWRDLIHFLNERSNRVPKKGESDEELYDRLAGDDAGAGGASGWAGFVGE